MKINYFFPVFDGDNFKEYFSNFKKSAFYKKWDNFKVFFVCNKNNKKNLEYLEEECKNNKNCDLIVLNENFTYNNAFYKTLNKFDGDILFLGDTNIFKIDIIFEKCFEKYEKQASVVHIVKKHSPFKSFFINIAKGVYNFFIKLFTNKTDRLNIISLGLIDKNILDILKTLPNKCCFLKNTKNLLGFETRTVYIPPQTKTYKPKFKEKTWALKLFIISCCFTFCVSLLLILLNCFIKNIMVYNIIGLIIVFLSLSSAIISLPKHIFDIRNYTSKNISEIVENTESGKETTNIIKETTESAKGKSTIYEKKENSKEGATIYEKIENLKEEKEAIKENNNEQKETNTLKVTKTTTQNKTKNTTKTIAKNNNKMRKTTK